MDSPRSVLSRPLLPASVAIYTTIGLAAFEGTAVAAALPQVVADLGRLDLLPWVITGFLFASGVTTVLSGSLIDRFGIRKMFVIAVTTFTVAGSLAGVATSMPILVAVRLIHGAGSGMVFSVAMTAVAVIYPGHLIGRAYAANSTVWGVMGATAPGLAAFMLTTLSWRWIFFLNVPLGLLALGVGYRVMPGRLEGADSLPIDVKGGVILAGLTLATLLAVDRIGLASIFWLGAAILLWLGYRHYAKAHPNPVLNPEYMSAHPVGPISFTVGLMLAAGFSASTYVTLYVSAGRGAGTTLTAWSVFFFTVGWTGGANLSSRLLDRRPETSVMLAGVATTVPGLTLAAFGVFVDAPLPWILFGLAAAGSGIGMTTNAGITLLRALSPPAKIGRVTSAHQFVRNQGVTLGSAIGGAILLLVVGSRLGSTQPVEALLAGNQLQGSASIAASVQAGYGWALVASTTLAASSALPLRVLRAHLAPSRRARPSVMEAGT